MKRKKINRRQLIHTFIFALFCVFGLTIAYAALSTTLNISGSASVNSSEWDIVIEKYSIEELYGVNYEQLCSSGTNICGDNYLLIGNAKVDKAPMLTNTTIKDFSFSATIPGDGVLFIYKVINKGTIPAKLESINNYTPVYTSTIGNDNDVLWAKNNTVFIVSLGTDTDTGEALSEGDILCPGEVNYIMLGFIIDENSTTIPSSAIEISNGGADYVFTQTELNSCPS